jgi:hypothetical protein
MLSHFHEVGSFSSQAVGMPSIVKNFIMFESIGSHCLHQQGLGSSVSGVIDKA